MLLGFGRKKILFWNLIQSDGIMGGHGLNPEGMAFSPSLFFKISTIVFSLENEIGHGLNEAVLVLCIVL